VGIRAALAAYPDTAGPLMALAEAVLRGPSSLEPSERELLAAAVSGANGCRFCALSHGAAARELLADRSPWVDAVLAGGLAPDLPPRLAGLVTLARAVAASPHGRADAEAQAARQAGASDRDLHDTILVTGLFCLFNRYVDGLGVPEPASEADYGPMGRRLASQGYHSPPNRR